MLHFWHIVPRISYVAHLTKKEMSTVMTRGISLQTCEDSQASIGCMSTWIWQMMIPSFQCHHVSMFAKTEKINKSNKVNIFNTTRMDNRKAEDNNYIINCASPTMVISSIFITQRNSWSTNQMVPQWRLQCLRQMIPAEWGKIPTRPSSLMM